MGFLFQPLSSSTPSLNTSWFLSSFVNLVPPCTDQPARGVSQSGPFSGHSRTLKNYQKFRTNSQMNPNIELRPPSSWPGRGCAEACEIDFPAPDTPGGQDGRSSLCSGYWRVKGWVSIPRIHIPNFRFFFAGGRLAGGFSFWRWELLWISLSTSQLFELTEGPATPSLNTSWFLSPFVNLLL